jgi:HSP20 family molecular chaperone IbpA
MSGQRRRPGSLSRHLSERARAGDAPPTPGIALDGILGGLKELMEAVGRTAEAARAQDGKAEPRVVFGYAINTLDGAVQAFGHVPRAAGAAASAAAAPAMPDARTPIVDVFEEAAVIVVVAEVPGLDPTALSLAVEDGALRIEGGGAQRYSHRVALPAAVEAAAMTHACRNGILEVRLPRAAGHGA